jgi:hemoglobin
VTSRATPQAFAHRRQEKEKHLVTRKFHLFAVVIASTISTGFAYAQNTVSTKELEKRADQAIFDVINIGVPIYNAGNHESCYQIYRGCCIATMRLLEHRADLKADLDGALKQAESITTAPERAFALRKAMDRVLDSVRQSKSMSAPPAATGEKALWERLGGEQAVRAVVHDFVIAAAPDPKVNFFRDGKFKLDDAGVKRLEQLLVELISATTGGPLKYTGRDMKSSHAGMAISEAEFGALAGHLIATLKKFNVPQKEIDELVTIVASTKKDIVEKSLWDRLGGEAAVKAVIHDFVIAAAPDPKVNFFRNGKFKLDDAGVAKLERLLVELVSATTGGPLKYTGRDMKSSHAGMEITEGEFNALAGHLVDTLKKYNVPQKEIDELVKIVASTKDDIVTKK